MRFKLSILLLSGILMTACSGVPEQTIVKVSYIALDDNGTNGPLVGCGDSALLKEESVTEVLLTEKSRITTALHILFANKNQFLGESGLYNALYQSTLTLKSVTIKEGRVTVELSGEPLSGGECDDPRIVEQIRETVRSNLDEEEKEFTLLINLNGKPLEKIQDLSGQ